MKGNHCQEIEGLNYIKVPSVETIAEAHQLGLVSIKEPKKLNPPPYSRVIFAVVPFQLRANRNMIYNHGEIVERVN